MRVFSLTAMLAVAACAPKKNENQNPVDYTCKDRKKISAVFDTGAGDKVFLKLGDGRSFTLPNVTAASGIKYATADEKIVFWAKGDEAFFEEAGKIVLEDCLADKPF